VIATGLVVMLSVCVHAAGDPTTDPIPVFDTDLQEKSFRVVVDFDGRMNATLRSADVSHGPARALAGNPPLLLVEAWGRHGDMLQRFNDWHPLWDFVWNTDGSSEALSIRGHGSAQLVFPFDRRATLLTVVDVPMATTVLEGSLTGTVHRFCQANPSDVDCERSDFAVTSITPLSTAPVVIVGQPLDVAVQTTFTNKGPAAPNDAALTTTVVAGSGVVVTPLNSMRDELGIALNEERVTTESYRVDCFAAGRRTIRFEGAVMPLEAFVVDPEQSNNHGFGELTVECRFPFWVRTEGRIGEGGSILTSLGVNDLAGLLHLAQRSEAADTTYLIADSIRIADAANVSNVFTNDLRARPSATIRSPVVTPLPGGIFPLAIPFCPVEMPMCGGEKMVVLSRRTHTFTPGVYGHVELMDGAKLVLTGPGRFDFCSLRAAGHVDIAVSESMHSTINVRGNFRIGDGSTFGPQRGDDIPRLNVTGTIVRIGRNAIVRAHTRAPFAQANAGERSEFVGSFCFDRLRASRRVTLRCSEPCSVP
jgi:hypothetical protein